MGKSFVEASTEIDELLNKKDELLSKIGNIVALAIVDRTNSNKLNSLQKDVDNLLKDMNDHEKYLVMLYATTAIAKNNANGGNMVHKSSSRSDLFNRF